MRSEREADMKIPSVPIDRKILLTFDEAAEYSGIDVIRIKELMEKDDLDLILWYGNRRYVKRRKLEDYLRKSQEKKTEDYDKWLGERVAREVRSTAVILPDGRIKIELYLERENIRDLITGNTSSDGQTARVNVAISLPRL